MGRGTVQLGLAVLLVCLGAASAGAVGETGRLLVDGDAVYVGQVNLVHVAVDAPRNSQEVEVRVTIEGEHGQRSLETRRAVEAAGPELLTVGWTPQRAGTHTLLAETYAGNQLLDVDERTVEVEPAPQPAGGEEGGMPATAPGTVQWAIAFGILFFVARAGLGGRS